MLITNYITNALRNIHNRKMFGFINILGIGIGVAVVILISVFVRDQLSYDKFWPSADQVFRLHTTLNSPAREPSVSIQAQGPVRDALSRYFPDQISAATRFTEMPAIMNVDGKIFNETIHLTDPDTTDIFPLDTISGDLTAALSGINGLAINETLASKLFPDSDPIGKIVTLSIRRLTQDYQIKAVFKDLPGNTVLSFQALVLIDEQAFPGRFDGWTSFSGPLYFKLNKNTLVNEINQNLVDFTDETVIIPEYTGSGGTASDYIKYTTMALPDLQLNADGWGEMKPTGDKVTIITFIAIAIFILLIASINFMNLLTAQSIQRSYEVALRKVLGARRHQLIYQFLTEAFIIASAGLLVGLSIVETVLPYYGEFLDRELVINYADGFTIGTLLGLVIVVTLLGGLHPALVSSNILPAKILRSNRSSKTVANVLSGNFLVVLQFSITISLVASTIIIYSQMSHMVNLDLGYNTDDKIIIKGMRSKGILEQQQVFNQELLRLDYITQTTYSHGVPGIGANGSIVA
ncbi:MAG: FtsX-like permease family protein, partial [Kordiimonadaceae bacterium]|nr:FtsX-like permease family protein [Kordiimonadaceae bacterium]